MLGIHQAWSKVASSFEAAFRLDSTLIYVPAVLAAALVIEALTVGFRQSTLARFRHIGKTNWALYAVQQLNLGILAGYAVSLGTLYFLFGYLHGIVAGLVAPEYRVTSAVAYLLAVDGLGYWYHRLLHTVPALWHLHHVHHSAPEFNIVNSFRSHPVESTLSRFFVALPAAALFIPDTAGLGAGMLGYLTATKLLNLLQHSKISSDLGLFGKVFVSPAHHRIHHSADPDHHNKNFGNSLIVWDKLFGSYCTAPRSQIEAIEIGLEDYDRKSSVSGYVLRTYILCIRDILAPLTNGIRQRGFTSKLVTARARRSE